jgi:hypothetical protein
MAQDWRTKAREIDKYLGRPTLTYRSTPTAGSPGPMTLINYVTTWMGCVLFCNHTGNAQFSLQSNNVTSELLPANADTQRGPFTLTPGTSVLVTWIDGTPTVGAIVWEDPVGTILQRQDRLIELLEEQNALLKGR